MTRPSVHDDGWLGQMPHDVHEPSSIDEAREVVAELFRDRRTSVCMGGGTKLGRGAAPARLDAVVRTRLLSRVVEYAPSDQVVTVEAGITLGALQATLAESGQRLSLDPPWPAESTLGGIIAANAFGPRRARSGSVRDLILGVSILRADGVLARGGGKVVKNVAGFDLPKLACASFGTLGMIALATMRVHPRPEATEHRVVRGLRAEGVPALVKAVRDAQLEPSALLAVRAGDGAASWDVALAFEGFSAGIAQQLSRLGAIAATEPADAALFDAHRAARESAWLRVKLAALPTALPQVEAALLPLVRELEGAELAWYPSLGLGFFSARAPAADRSAAVLSALASARQKLAALRGSVTLEAIPEVLRGKLAAWPVPSSLPLHQALKARLDPEGLLAPGTFVGGV